MGWASGSEIAIKLIPVIRDNVEDENKRKLIYESLYDSLRDQDWDTVDEAQGIDPAFDEIAGIGEYSDEDCDEDDDDDDLA